MSRQSAVTQAQIQAFLAKLSERANVTEACRVSGLGRANAYRLKAVSPEFAQRWDEAVAAADDRLMELIADLAGGERTKMTTVAGEGVEQAIYSERALELWARMRFRVLRQNETRVEHAYEPGHALFITQDHLALLDDAERGQLIRLLSTIRQREQLAAIPNRSALPAPEIIDVEPVELLDI